MKNYVIFLLLTIIIVLNISCEDKSEPEVFNWSISGKLYVKSGAEIDLSDEHIKIGVFPYGFAQYNPDVNNIVPKAGISSFNSDGSFTISIDANDISNDYLHVFVWYDEDEDGKLDAQDELYDQPVESDYFDENICYFYHYEDETEAMWVNGVTSEFVRELKDLQMTDMKMYVNSDIIKLNKTWSLSGLIQATQEFKIDFSSEQVKIGAFSYSSNSFNPVTNNVIPIAGFEKVNTDGSFNLNINTTEVKESYIFVLIWFDINNDDQLDVKEGELFNFPVEGNYFGGNYCYYYSSPVYKNGWVNQYSDIPAKSLTNLEMYADWNIVEQFKTWEVSGTIQSTQNDSIDFESGKIKIGAFPSESSFNPTINNIVPRAGVGSANTDGTFSLTINTTDITENNIFIVLWYDLNNNNKLDVEDGELFDNAVEGKYFGGDNFYYSTSSYYNNGWVNSYTSLPAENLTGAEVYVNENLVEQFRTWNITGIIQPSLNEKIDFESEHIKIGAFPAGRSFDPSVNNIVPQAGMGSINTDGEFSLTINTTEVIQDYIYILVWFDSNNDNQLDIEAGELFDFPIEGNYFGGENLYYYSSPSFNGGWVNAFTNFPAQNASNMEMYINTHLVEQFASWNMNGTVQTQRNDSIDFESGKIKIGAFPTSFTSNFPSINNIVPKAGYGSVDLNGNFSFTLNTSGITENYIFLIVWYDANDDNEIDNLDGESFYRAIEGKYFGGDNSYYYYDRNSKYMWMNQYTDTPAEALSNLEMYIAISLP